MGPVKTVTIQQALQQVANYPVMLTDELVQVPAHELVSRALFEISNNPDASVRGSYARANKARKMILDRLVGKRRAGTHPATRTEVHLEFRDLTAVALPPTETPEEGDDGAQGVQPADR